jgi:hypothetical protein
MNRATVTLLERALEAARPFVNSIDLMSSGNRKKDVRWKPFREGIRLTDVARESAHTFMEAESKLRTLMLELRIPEPETDALIAAIR